MPAYHLALTHKYDNTSHTIEQMLSVHLLMELMDGNRSPVRVELCLRKLQAHHLLAWVQAPCVPRNRNLKAEPWQLSVPLEGSSQSPRDSLVPSYQCYIPYMEVLAGHLHLLPFLEHVTSREQRLQRCHLHT